MVITQPFNVKTSFFTELCVKTPDISCRSLIQIGLQIPRWRTKWRPCKGMAAYQAYIFHFKWYSLLHFAVCQLLCWAFLFIRLSQVNNDANAVLNFIGNVALKVPCVDWLLFSPFRHSVYMRHTHFNCKSKFSMINLKITRLLSDFYL